MIPDIGVSNGVMSVILNYAKAMPKDIVFDVLYFQDKNPDKRSEIESLGGRAFKISFPSVKSLLYNSELDKLFCEHQGEWEAFHIHAPHFTPFASRYAKKYGIKKICSHCHTSVFSLNEANEKRNKLLASSVKYLTDKRFACSNESGSMWYNCDYTVLNNAVDCKKFQFNPDIRINVREKMQLEDKLVIGHIGRTDIVQKNHPFLIDVFSEIHKSNSNSVLLLIGAESDEELTNKCRDYGITDSVFFLGIRDDIHDLLQAIDVFVFPSISEGLPVSVIEAQASGIPCLVSEAITKEVFVSEEILSLPLSTGASIWAQKAIELSKLGRKDNYCLMQKAGWNIYDCAKELADYYRS